MGFRICVPSVLGKFEFSDMVQPYAGDSVREWGSSCFLNDHIYAWSRARRHMHDGVYSFELGVVSFNIIMKRSGFARGSQVFSLRICIDRSSGGHNRGLTLLGRRIPFAGRYSELMEFGSQRLGFPKAVFGLYALRFFPYICFVIGSGYLFGLVVRCLFRPARCNSNFAVACSNAEVIASYLPCSIRIGRSGFLEY